MGKNIPEENLERFKASIDGFYDALLKAATARGELVSAYEAVFSEYDRLTAVINRCVAAIKEYGSQNLDLMPRGKVPIYSAPVAVYTMKSFTVQLDLNALPPDIKQKLIDDEVIIERPPKINKAALKKNFPDVYADYCDHVPYTSYVAVSHPTNHFLATEEKKPNAKAKTEKASGAKEKRKGGAGKKQQAS